MQTPPFVDGLTGPNTPHCLRQAAAAEVYVISWNQAATSPNASVWLPNQAGMLLDFEQTSTGARDRFRDGSDHQSLEDADR